jgi:predicted O-methyltransferase YrrM
MMNVKIDEYILDEIKSKALENHIPIIMDETLEVIANILSNENPKKILEIGTAIGYSAIQFLKHSNTDTIIDTIEIDEKRVIEANENIEKLGLQKNIHVMQGNAVDILPTLKDEYDIIFIDAAKGKYPVFLKEAIRLGKLNAIIFADNILYKGYVMGDYNKHKQRTAVNNLREYIRLIKEDKRLETEILEVGDGLAISRKIAN